MAAYERITDDWFSNPCKLATFSIAPASFTGRVAELKKGHHPTAMLLVVEQNHKTGLVK